MVATIRATPDASGTGAVMRTLPLFQLPHGRVIMFREAVQALNHYEMF